MLDCLIGKSCLVYLDEIIIYGKTFEETLAILKLVMARQKRMRSIFGIWKLLQAAHQKLLCNNSHSTVITKEFSPLQVG